MREEQATFGVDEPPFAAMFFGAEEAGGLELRTGFPAAVLVPVIWAGVSGEIFGLGVTTLLKFGNRVRFARPVFVQVLAEGVNEGEKGVGVLDRSGWRDVSAGSADFSEFELMVGTRVDSRTPGAG